MKMYKGFNKDMTCRGFQYEEGKTYELPEGEEAKLCESGFHACEAPLNTWDYYPPVDGNRFREVELDGLTGESSNDSKRCGKRIKIGEEIGIPELVKAHIEYVKEQIKECDSVQENDSSGDDAQIGSSGFAAKIGSSGRYAKIGSAGDDVMITCDADHAVVACSGRNAKIKAPIGTWFSLAEYGDWYGDGYPCICMKSAKIDGEILKPDTWYTLQNGEFKEVTDDEK